MNQKKSTTINLSKENQIRTIECDSIRTLTNFSHSFSNQFNIIDIEANKNDFSTKIQSLLLKLIETDESFFYTQGFNEIVGIFYYNFELDLFNKIPMCLIFFKYFFYDFQCSDSVEKAAYQCLDSIIILIQLVNISFHNFLIKVGCSRPMYALQWIISWFSRSCTDLEGLFHIYDYLICSKPLTIIYMATSWMLFNEEKILHSNFREYTDIHYFFQEVKHNKDEISEIIQITEGLIRKVNFKQLSRIMYQKYDKDLLVIFSNSDPQIY